IIDASLEKLWVMAIILILGGILFLFIEKLFKNETIFEEEKITNFTSFKVGLFQCLAIFFPGLSRSAATILGGMSLGLSRQVAAEFSFFLAVPTMFAATIYKIYEFVKEKGRISNEEIKLLAFGNIIAFIVALLAIKLFIEMVKKFGFKPWGWYRIIAGSVVLLLIYFKIIQ
ncbi:MAG: undecaprenyl-diphosphate phosphatase, partial [Chitinophagaceae bacterium]|nr:undecaprenyl-diphosphate phosphatase [Chitinophagaceae bacterium]